MRKGSRRYAQESRRLRLHRTMRSQSLLHSVNGTRPQYNQTAACESRGPGCRRRASCASTSETGAWRSRWRAHRQQGPQRYPRPAGRRGRTGAPTPAPAASAASWRSSSSSLGGATTITISPLVVSPRSRTNSSSSGAGARRTSSWSLVSSRQSATSRWGNTSAIAASESYDAMRASRKRDRAGNAGEPSQTAHALAVPARQKALEEEMLAGYSGRQRAR